jgi:REP element-mobilizing transposase RayT
MSRDYKNFRKDTYYHIYNRGNDYKDVFIDDQDYFNLYKRIKILLGLSFLTPKSTHRKGNLSLKPFPADSFSIISYCFMPNHFHFLIKQNSNIPIGSFIQRLFSSYTKYFNAKYETVGNLFQDTFKAKPVLEDSYLIYLTAYIHNNPDDLLAYPYSSFIEYITGEMNLVSDDNIILEKFGNSREVYKSWVISNNTGVDHELEP